MHFMLTWSLSFKKQVKRTLIMISSVFLQLFVHLLSLLFGYLLFATFIDPSLSLSSLSCFPAKQISPEMTQLFVRMNILLT